MVAFAQESVMLTLVVGGCWSIRVVGLNIMCWSIRVVGLDG
jgi:hypothetical protein